MLLRVKGRFRSDLLQNGGVVSEHTDRNTSLQKYSFLQQAEQQKNSISAKMPWTGSDKKATEPQHPTSEALYCDLFKAYL